MIVKKKPKHYIIPAYNFISIAKSDSSYSKNKEVTAVSEPIEDSYKSPKLTTKIDKVPKKPVIEKPMLNTDRRRSSALSLNSIHKKDTKKRILRNSTQY